jgi:type II restriction/modification system DNA methylase subunit YeeA
VAQKPSGTLKCCRRNRRGHITECATEDPACGSGAFLIRAYEALDAHYKAIVHGLAGAGMPAEDVAALEDAVPDLILNHNLYGVDLSEQAVEITQLALWIRSARKGHTLLQSPSSLMTPTAA